MRTLDVPLSTRVRQIAPSATLALNQKARELKAEGKDVVSLTAGEPDAPCPSHVTEAVARAVRNGETRYTAVAGIPEVRDAVAERYRAWGVHADRVILTAGGKQALYNAFLCLLEDGDQVLGFSPYWLSYPDMVALCGGRWRALPTDSGFLPEAETLDAAIGPRTKAVVLNSPSNPTGAVIPEGRMRALTDVLRKHPHVTLIFDEIYDRLVYPNARFVSPLEVAPDLLNRTVLVNGGSKTYAMTGLRAGWAVAPPELVTAMSKVQGQTTSHASAPIQRGLQAALQGEQSFVTEMVSDLNRRRKALFEGLKHITGIHCPEPKGAFYAFVRLGPRGMDSDGNPDSRPVCESLLLHHNLVVVPGEPFGGPGHIRLSFAVSDATLAEALSRLQQGLAE